MNDDEQTPPPPSMDDRIRNVGAERQRAGFARLFATIVEEPAKAGPESADVDDGDDAA